ncbi:IclR family transcriptional regulator [Granulicella sp. WH15]|uniref:IclR family transcriptional regulator n=1 Tax=Granulicella sp. WH15 TaxID=2602070 RepID=UPI001366C591|nr:IclR family transcriptional regulator [Granulicella sp. WH15]QHN04972.1 IclR family transcriptional regulator [Granulicella sp. WH15]
MRAKSKSAPVGVITKVLKILELLDRAPDGLQLRDLARQTGINKSTVHRFASHLEAEAYLFRDAGGTYTLGPKLARLGSGISFQATLCKICRPMLEHLWKVTGETINLAILDGSDVLYLDILETLHTFRLVSKVGMRRPFHCTSLGKAIVANIKDEQVREQLFANVQFDEGKTPRSITSIGRLKRDLVNIRERGFALDEGEAVTGVRCLGAAILGADGKVVGGISISGPMVRVTRELLPLFSMKLREAAQEISTCLGYRPAEKNKRPDSSAFVFTQKRVSAKRMGVK